MSLSSILSRLNPTALVSGDFRRNEAGVAAIEFSLIAPMMIGMYFGLAEMATAISMDRKISHAAHVAGDLATQAPSANATDIQDILSATLRVVDKSDASQVKIRLVSLKRNSDDTVEAIGEVLLNGQSSDFEARETQTISNSILSENSGVVLAQISYVYSPLKLKYFDTDITLEENFMLKPRRSKTIIFGTDEDDDKEIRCTSTGKYTVKCEAPVASSAPY